MPEKIGPSQLNLRVTPDEYAEWKNLAQEDHLPVTTWVKQQVKRQVELRKKSVQVPINPALKRPPVW